MAEKVELSRQINALRGFIALAEAKGIPGDMEAVNTSVKSLEWLQKNMDCIQLAQLIKRDEAVKAIFEQWPEAAISAVRKIRQQAA